MLTFSDNRIPRGALILGLAGLIPFLWGALVHLGLFSASMGDPANGGYVLIVAADGQLLMIRYGTIILAFMSGVLWGFATRGEGAVATSGYVISVLPALWAFGATGGGPVDSCIALMAGFAGVLAMDYMFWQQGLAPVWWMKLRVLLTAIVLVCLGAGAFL